MITLYFIMTLKKNSHCYNKAACFIPMCSNVLLCMLPLAQDPWLHPLISTSRLCTHGVLPLSAVACCRLLPGIPVPSNVQQFFCYFLFCVDFNEDKCLGLEINTLNLDYMTPTVFDMV